MPASNTAHDLGSSDFSDPKKEQMLVESTPPMVGKDNQVSAEQVEGSHSGLVHDIATDAKANISVMKLDVDAALHDTQMTHMHLLKYKEFIERKRKQRIQCIRDMQLHCCQCDGPHISKPPFRHGKDYRKDPLHSQYQAENCQFLKKKQTEMNWLDTTLGNYDKNNEQYELEIEKRKAETQCRKDTLKEALANSLRLMEIASDDLQSYPESIGIPETVERPIDCPHGEG